MESDNQVLVQTSADNDEAPLIVTIRSEKFNIHSLHFQCKYNTVRLTIFNKRALQFTLMKLIAFVVDNFNYQYVVVCNCDPICWDWKFL